MGDSAMPSSIAEFLPTKVFCGPGGPSNFDPYVRARIGVANHTGSRQTKPNKGGGAAPAWDKSCDHEMKLRPPGRATDQGLLVVEVWDNDKYSRDNFVGGNQLDVGKYMEAPGREFEETCILYEQGKSDGGTDTGTLTLKIKWVPSGEKAAEPSESPRAQSAPNGRLHVTAVVRPAHRLSNRGSVRPRGFAQSASELRHPDVIIRDLSTFVDFTAVYISLSLIFFHLLIGCIFFMVYMARDHSDHEQSESLQRLLDRVHGQNGPWDFMNTAVFLTTAFTTVGYGNHPSLVQTKAPCSYPGDDTEEGDPTILRDAAARTTAGHQFVPPPASCFNGDSTAAQPECWVVADDTSIFDFNALLYWVNYESQWVNYTARAGELRGLSLPGLFGTADSLNIRDEVSFCRFPEESESDDTSGIAQFDCFERYRDLCAAQRSVWRDEEARKTHGKIYCVFFIIVGIGLLGNAAGALGKEILTWVHKVFANVELALDTVSLDNAKTVGEWKSAIVALLGMLIILVIGTAVYASLEGLGWVDALYFTVVTATTVGFGDYVPESQGSKWFTIIFVPLSVSMVAGAINHVAKVPLAKRDKALENFVLAQFGENLTQGDFDEIRRTVGLPDDASITSNDFLLAMLVRLGRVQVEDTVKCRRLFTKLDRDGSGALDDSDIRNLLTDPPDTKNLDEDEEEEEEGGGRGSSPQRSATQDVTDGIPNPVASGAAT